MSTHMKCISSVDIFYSGEYAKNGTSLYRHKNYIRCLSTSSCLYRTLTLLNVHEFKGQGLISHQNMRLYLKAAAEK